MAWKCLPFLGMLLFASCSSQVPQSAIPGPPPVAAGLPAVPSLGPNNAGPEFKRFIAVRHELLVETAESELPKAWQSIQDFCGTVPCEITASSICQKSHDSPPSATLSLRIAPEQITPLMKRLEAVGSILEHKTESADETAAVIDVEAKIKNLTGLRDRLRKMLGSPNAGLRDILEVDRELSTVQSELDGLQTTRKALANETEKVSVAISFCVRKSVAETGAFAPVAAAWCSLGHVFAESIASAVVFAVAAIPWLVLFIPALWLCVKALERCEEKSNHSPSSFSNP